MSPDKNHSGRVKKSKGERNDTGRLRPGLLTLLGIVVFALSSTPIMAQDFASREEEKSRELLRLMEEAPPAPMPDRLAPSPGSSEASAQEKGHIIGYDPGTGATTIGTPSREAAGPMEPIPGHHPTHPQPIDATAPFPAPEWMLPEGEDRHDLEGANACTLSNPSLSTLSVPLSAVYKLLVRFSSGATDYYYVCSAAAVGAFHLVTAGHCLYNHDPNQDGSTADASFAVEVWAWAGQTDYVNPYRPATWSEDRPFSLSKMTFGRTYVGWSQNQDLDYDMAYLTLDRREGDHTGWLGREADNPASSLNFSGYPTETPYVSSGEIRQYAGYDAGNVNYYSSNRINMCAFLYGGHSGGPVWRYDGTTRYLHGVISTSDRQGLAEATLLTSTRVNDITAIISEDEANRPPLARPDLAEYLFTTVDDKKDLLVNSVEEGGPFSVEYNALNAGFADAGTVTIDFYLSTNTTISTFDTLIGTRTWSLSAWSYINETTTLFANIAPGTYYLGWIMRSSVSEYGGDQTCTNDPCSNVVVIADETLTVTPSSGCSADAYEPDGGSSQASLLIPGATQTHNICPASDTDWATFTLDNSATDWHVTLGTSGPSGDTRMWLYNSSVSQLEFNDDSNGTLFSEIERECAVDALAPGTYYVAVDEFNNNDEIDTYYLELDVSPCATPEPDIHVEPLDLVFGMSGSSASKIDRGEGTRALGDAVPSMGPSFEKRLAARKNEALARLESKAREDGTVRIIVGLATDRAILAEGYLAGSQAIEEQRGAIRNAQEELDETLEGTDGILQRRFRHVPFAVVQAGPEALERLGKSEKVFSIEEDVPVPPLMSSSNAVIGSPTAWAAGYDGSGQTVAVLDTGVDKDHPWFTTGGDTVVSEACYSSNTSDSSSLCPGGVETSTASGAGVDCSAALPGCDHGTHVAGTVAGNDGTGPGYGVARGADLIAIQVFSRFDSVANCGSPPCVLSYVSDQIAGLERVYELRDTYDIAAVNMSLGGGRYFTESDCDAANVSQKAAIDNLLSVGIATVIASGNNGYTTSMGSPGCISTAVSVGATDDADDVASFSNVASFLDLVAPGVSITSSVPGTGTGTKNGTSMATPHVAGAFAVLGQASPSASVSQILNILRATGTSVDDDRIGGTVNDLRRIDLGRAITQGGGGNGQSFSIRNEGSATLSVTSMGLTSAGSWIDWSPKAPLAVASGASVTVTVSVDMNLAPNGVTTRRLQILSNDPDESPYPAGVDVEVHRDASLIFSDGFESGDMTVWSSTN